MGLFNKKGPEIVDYTLLEKKGLLKKRKEKKLPFKINSGGFIELGNSNEKIVADEVAKENNFGERESQSLFSFLDNLAETSSAPSVSPEPTSVLMNENNVAGVNEANNNINSDVNSDINAIKIKIDDLEYKLERFVEKLSAIEEKIAKYDN